MIFYHVKVNRAFLPSLISLLSLVPFVLTTRGTPLILNLATQLHTNFQVDWSVVYLVGVSKDCSCFTQVINYNAKGLKWILTKISKNN